MTRASRGSRVLALAGAAGLFLLGCSGGTAVEDEGVGGNAALSSGGRGAAQSGGSAGMGGSGARATGGSGAIGFGGLGGVGGGGTGAVGTGGAGIGGAVTGGAPAACADSDQLGAFGYGQPQSDPEVRGTTSGVNGTFNDECDAAGNLIEYSCEVAVQTGSSCWGAAPGPAAIVLMCPMIPTGNVLSVNIDCAGECVDGTCISHCPEVGQQLRYESIANGAVTLENITVGRTYQCTVVFDDAQDTYDCTASGRLGSIVNVYSLGLADQFCLGTAVGNIGIDDPTSGSAEECAFSCTSLP